MITLFGVDGTFGDNMRDPSVSVARLTGELPGRKTTLAVNILFPNI